jgi:hypothetical protein
MRQGAYLTAYDAARSELSEVLGEFERLRIRKEQIEKVALALEPLFDSQAQVPAADQQPTTYSFELLQRAPAPVAESEPLVSEQVEMPVPVQVMNSPESTSDPVQMRINAALWGITQGNRELLAAS